MNQAKHPANRQTRSGLPEDFWENARTRANVDFLKQSAEDCIRDHDPALSKFLSKTADPELALEQFAKWHFANLKTARPVTLGTLWEGKGRALDCLLRVLGSGKVFGDHLARHPESIEAILHPVRRSPSLGEMVGQLHNTLDQVADEPGQIRILRRFRMEQLLRIAINDLFRERPLEEITKDISRVADAALEVALSLASNRIAPRFGLPFESNDKEISCCLLAMGKLGGEELNYSSDIDVLLIYSAEGTTRNGKTQASSAEYHSRLISEVIRLLSAHSEEGIGWRIDLRLRPNGASGPLAMALGPTLAYYDNHGRTWERQALIKVRTVAGNVHLGKEFCRDIQEFVYRNYLSFSEISEIKALKRRIERRSVVGSGGIDIKTGRGGIRDIEYTIQFLQLLNGGTLPDIRQRNTLLAMAALERHGCLTDQEFRVLDDSYRFFRHVEHKLQLVSDLQTHRIPHSESARLGLARRMGFTDLDIVDPWKALQERLGNRTEPIHTILNHLVHQAFPGTGDQAETETDILLDPDPDPMEVKDVLTRHRFASPDLAHKNLLRLAKEPSPFLSSLRTRHFFSSIAPALLRSTSLTADPDATLAQLERITSSLGGKSGLWELLSFHKPSMKLLVDICSSGRMLGELLMDNPGMIDELLDALLLGHARTHQELSTELSGLLRGAMDRDLILRSFRDKELLGIGIREMTGGEGIDATNRAITDLAEVLLLAMASQNQRNLEKELGIPWISKNQPCQHVLVALGRLGAGQMSYFSDLDLIWIYEDPGPKGPLECDFHQWHTTLAQGLVRASAKAGGTKPLFEIDLRLRPTGRSGSLALPLGEFIRYHSGHGCGRLWERLALTRFRILGDSSPFSQLVQNAIHEVISQTPWQSAWVAEAQQMRKRLEASRSAHSPASPASGRDLKRAAGGMVDVEFVVELLQICHGATFPQIIHPNTFKALTLLAEASCLPKERAKTFLTHYSHLSKVQNRVRLLFNRAVDTLPDSPTALAILAAQLGFSSGTSLQHSVYEAMNAIRAAYLVTMSELENRP